MIRRGRGMACMWYPIGFTVAANPSAATVKVNTDGTATPLTWTVETDQGNVTFGKGDFVTFPKGLSCVWDIKAPVNKHYNFR